MREDVERSEISAGAWDEMKNGYIELKSTSNEEKNTQTNTLFAVGIREEKKTRQTIYSGNNT